MPSSTLPRRGTVSCLLVASLVLSLPACAAEPFVSWEPPHLPPVPGIEQTANPGTSGEALAETEVDPERSPTSTPKPPDPTTLGLVPGRLRHDGAALAARFVYVPGVPEFNAWMNAKLWEEIRASGVAYEPQVHPVEAGLSDRGCVPGSSGWPAAEVLARADTGPADGAGIAIVCDIAGAFGDLLELRVRAVAGSSTGVTRDDTVTIYINVSNGSVFQLPVRWNEPAALELWQAVVELLRRDAGALSTAPLEAPGEAQLELARTALDGARGTQDGGLLVPVPAGLVAPELEGLGIDVTTEPLEVRVDAQIAETWSNPDYLALHEGWGAPFSGVRAAATSVPIDCALVPCVALTYDDGPSGYTPQLLDIFAAHQASATFFMVGGYAINQPDLVRRAVAEGHEVASHTMSHPTLTRIPLDEARAQVRGAADVLTEITGQPVTMFRPPFGEVSSEVIEAVGLPAILWSIDTNDWRVPGQEALFERAVLGARRGDIILFHDTHLDSVEAADAVIRGLRDRGIEPVTVTELFGGVVPPGRVSRA